MLRSLLNRIGSVASHSKTPTLRRKRHRRSGFAPAAELETRTLLATLVGANKVTYQDTDGDTVSVTFSKSFLTNGNVNLIFTFQGDIVDGSNATKTRLKSINLNGLAAAAGSSITIVSTRDAVAGGDGLATLGEILADVDLKDVTVDGDLGRLVIGDTITSTLGANAIKVQSLGRFGTTTGALTNASSVKGGLNSLIVKGDVLDASFQTGQGIGSIFIGGSLIGVGSSGRIAAGSKVNSLTIGGDVVGGSGLESGHIHLGGVGTLTIGGSLIGGSGEDSGFIRVLDGNSTIKIAGDILGGSGQASGFIDANGVLSSLTARSIIGGIGIASGIVSCDGKVVSVKISQNLRGGAGVGSGRFVADADIDSLTVGGNIIGGTGHSSGGVTTAFHLIKAISVGGDIRGGSGPESGNLLAGRLGATKVGGSLIGGTATKTGSIFASDTTTLTIAGDVVGGSASGNQDLEISGAVHVSRIGSMTVGGSIRAGFDNTSGLFLNNGAIIVGNDIGTLMVKGSLIGNGTNMVRITANGQQSPSASSDVAISKLTVSGRVEYSNILAGTSQSGTPVNADAQIGTVLISGDWIASNLVAGVSAGVDGKYGTADDVKFAGMGIKDSSGISSKIGSLTIGGQIIGTPGGANDHFGFVAENIGAFKLAGTTIPMAAGNGNDNLLVTPIIGIFAGDVRLNEV